MANRRPHNSPRLLGSIGIWTGTAFVDSRSEAILIRHSFELGFQPVCKWVHPRNLLKFGRNCLVPSENERVQYAINDLTKYKVPIFNDFQRLPTSFSDFQCFSTSFSDHPQFPDLRKLSLRAPKNGFQELDDLLAINPEIQIYFQSFPTRRLSESL